MQRGCSSLAPLLRSEVAAGRVGPAATEQHGVAPGVARDEPLRDQHLADRAQALLQVGVRLEVAGGRQVIGAFGSARAFLGMQQLARVEPLGVDALVLQERGADPRRHEFAVGHDARAQAIADLADQVDALGAASEFGEVMVELGGHARHAEVAGQVHVTTLDLVHDRFPLIGQGFREQLFESVGDARKRRVHDDRVEALGEPLLDDGGDALPVADARNAGAPELEDHPVAVAMTCHRADPTAPCVRVVRRLRAS
jgi:hypothetical protein